MSDRINQYSQNPSYLYPDGGSIDNPNDPNNIDSPANPLSGADPLHLQTFEGVRSPNKYSGSTMGQGDGGDPDTQETSQTLQSAGIPGYGPQQINAAEARVNSDPDLQQGVDQMSQSMNQLGVGDPTEQAGAAANVFNAGEQLAKAKNIDIWQLLVVALKGATRDQNEQLRDDLSQLKVLSKVSSQMSAYSDVLQAAQQAIDNKMSAEKDDKKKQNIEVKLNDQRQYSQGDMDHLLGDGTVNFTQTADQDPNHQADRDTSHNMVSSSGLNVKIQNFSQERDQLQKNIDKRTQKYQSDNENKNQVVAAITAVLKNYYDMMSNTARNTDL